jgi:HlyD family secretion protein
MDAKTSHAPKRNPGWAGRLDQMSRRVLEGHPDPAATAASPRRDIRNGLIVLGLFLLVFVGWGLLIPLNAGVYAPGQVVVFGNRQSVQHKDGGIVSELDVHEGDRVAAGQVLLKLLPDELQASERATADQVFALEALEARLLAEINGASHITPPADFANLTGVDRESAQNAMAIQQREFESRAADLNTQKAVLHERETQLEEQIGGYREQLAANRQQQSLITDEINGLKDLLDRGLVPMTRMRSLERDAAQLGGAAGEYSSDIASTQQQIGQTRLQASDLDRQRVADVSKDFRDAQMELSQAQPKLAAIQGELNRLTVRSPAAGRVVGLTIFTVGGVVGPGQKLMDVVPANEPLVIEAKVKPIDASDIKVGQATEIRVPAFHDRQMPLLIGYVSRISADSLADDKTGAPYFKLEVTVPPSSVATINKFRGADYGLKPGLPVEVVVQLHNRTALSYLIGPLRDMLWKSFREH